MAGIASFTYHRMASPLGTLLLLSDEGGCLCGLSFDDDERHEQERLTRRFGERGYAMSGGPAPDATIRALRAYFGGELAALDAIPVRAHGTEFQQRVWAALRGIPAGTTATYGQIAREIGRPTATRAVGLANGANPVGIVVPCHRVMGANGKLTGYAGGLERKQWLLDHEQYRATTTAAVATGSLSVGLSR